MAGYFNYVSNFHNTPGIWADPQSDRPATPLEGTVFFNSTQNNIQRFQAGSWVDYSPSSTANFIRQGGNTFGAAVVIGSNDAFGLNLRTNSTTFMSATSAGAATFAFGVTFNNILSVNNVSQSIIFGVNNGSLPAGANLGQVIIGRNHVVNSTANSPTIIGSGNTIGGNFTGAVLIGASQIMTTADSGNVMLGESNTFNSNGGTVSGGCFIIGRGNSVQHRYSAVMGQGVTTTAANQLVFAQSSGNDDSGGFNEIYFGTGIRSGKQSGNAAPTVRIQAGGAGTTSADRTGSKLVLAAGKGAGASTPPDLEFETAVATASGTTLQALQAVGRFKGNTGKFEVISTVKTGQPSAAGAGEWLLGKKIAGGTGVVITDYLEVSVDGVTYKIALTS